MYYTLCGIYRDPAGPSKEKEASKPSKGVMREYDGAEFIPYHYKLKVQQEIIQKGRNLAFKEAENWT